MRSQRAVLVLTFLAVTVRAEPPPETILTLNNFGGYSHPGRRVVVFADGHCADVSYTDVIGTESSRRRSCTLDPQAGRLSLDNSEQLLRTDHEGKEYWVHEQEARRIGLPGEQRLRQTSLRNTR